jgi:chromosome segregation ATPase
MRRTRCTRASAVGDPRWAMLALAVLVAATVAAPSRATTYKWVDEKGVVHYTDKIPADAVNKGSTVLDKQARPVKKIDPALTPEQVRAREADEEQRRVAARLAEEVARRDRALVASYTTESEIDLARTRSLQTIDAQIDSAQSYVASLRKRRDELEKRKAALAGQQAPVALERELEGTNEELAKQARLLELKQSERAAVITKYDADKLRWRELRAISEASEAAGRATSLHPASAGGNAAPKK